MNKDLKHSNVWYSDLSVIFVVRNSKPLRLCCIFPIMIIHVHIKNGTKTLRTNNVHITQALFRGLKPHFIKNFAHCKTHPQFSYPYVFPSNERNWARQSEQMAGNARRTESSLLCYDLVIMSRMIEETLGIKPIRKASGKRRKRNWAREELFYKPRRRWGFGSCQAFGMETWYWRTNKT